MVKCKNKFCYLEIDGRCYFDDVIINQDGRCALCNPIRPTEERLADIKEKVRKEKEDELRHIAEHTCRKD